MSQVKQNLIAVNLKAGNFTLAAKLALQGFYRGSQDPEYVGKFGYIDQTK